MKCDARGLLDEERVSSMLTPTFARMRELRWAGPRGNPPAVTFVPAEDPQASARGSTRDQRAAACVVAGATSGREGLISHAPVRHTAAPTMERGLTCSWR